VIESTSAPSLSFATCAPHACHPRRRPALKPAAPVKAPRRGVRRTLGQWLPGEGPGAALVGASSRRRRRGRNWCGWRTPRPGRAGAPRVAACLGRRR
jgi:hypothetical protein